MSFVCVPRFVSSVVLPYEGLFDVVSNLFLIVFYSSCFSFTCFLKIFLMRDTINIELRPPLRWPCKLVFPKPMHIKLVGLFNVECLQKKKPTTVQEPNFSSTGLLTLSSLRFACWGERVVHKEMHPFEDALG